MALRFAAARLPVLRTLLPRVTAPLLPISLGTSSASALTRSSRPLRGRLFPNLPARLASTSSSNPHSLPKNPSISQRLKHLVKSYGWYALGVYIIFSALDFSIAFAAINLLGAQQVSAVALSVKTTVSGFLYSMPPEPGKDEVEPTGGHGQEGLYAMLVLAYTVHKTLFFPIRVGLTAALTPRIVNWLRTRGWAGGAGTRRAAEEMRERFRDRINRD